MNYGLYVSASGVLTHMYRQDVFANNLSNVHTAGFKPDVPAIRQRDPAWMESQLGFDVSHRLLDRLGGGVLAGPQMIDFTQGQFQKTGKPLDVALEGRDHFFAVMSVNPNNNQQAIRLTRDGQFQLNANSELVTSAGHRVLDVQDQPIAVPAGAIVTIDTAGRVLVNDEPTAQLQVAQVADLTRLEKHGKNLFRFEGQDPRQILPNPHVHAGTIEVSGTDPIRTLMDLVEATKSAMSNANVMRYHDTLMDQTVNVLGRVG